MAHREVGMVQRWPSDPTVVPAGNPPSGERTPRLSALPTPTVLQTASRRAHPTQRRVEDEEGGGDPERGCTRGRASEPAADSVRVLEERGPRLDRALSSRRHCRAR
jgi:hypothetical protein